MSATVIPGQVNSTVYSSGRIEAILRINESLKDQNKVLQVERVRLLKDIETLKESHNFIFNQISELTNELNNRTIMTPVEYRQLAVTLLANSDSITMYNSTGDITFNYKQVIERIYKESLEVCRGTGTE